MTERGLKLRDIFRKKYGVDHPSQLPSVKEKIKKKRESGAYDNVGKKMKQTLLEKYGDENFVNVSLAKQTKKERYGDENYNNRKKMLQTNNEKYGMNVSPNTLKSTTDRSNSGQIGFGSELYRQYLIQRNITNISQLDCVKKKNKDRQHQLAIRNLFFGNRLKSIVTPLFSPEEYINAEYNTLYKFKCNQCQNNFEDTLYSGNIPRCLVCYPHIKFQSKAELEIVSFLESHKILVNRHDRTILNGDEIDILIPDKKMGIEYNGIIWHSEIFGNKDKNYHSNKTSMSNSKNYSLIHILDWEWINKKEIVKGMLLNKLGLSSKIHARKCIIKEVSPKNKSEFVENNHIQGNDISSVNIGLFYINELVSVMTFSKSRFDKKYEYEMSRYCNKIGYSVVGGASKLFSYFLKTYNPSSVVSYCDRRFFNGEVYKKIGMNQISITPQSYHYFHKNYCVPINRLKFQKHKLHKILKIYDPNLTEWQNMQLNGYDRIWDCGHYKYEWIKT